MHQKAREQSPKVSMDVMLRDVPPTWSVRRRASTDVRCGSMLYRRSRLDLDATSTTR